MDGPSQAQIKDLATNHNDGFYKNFYFKEKDVSHEMWY